MAALRKDCLNVLSGFYRQSGLTAYQRHKVADYQRHKVADCLDQAILSDTEVRAVDADLVGGAN